jgi:ribosomal protein S18 acetylase RimI-like enzyme
VEVQLKIPAAEMAQEEIPKKIAFLDKAIREIRFLRNGEALEFEAPEDRADEYAAAAVDIAYQMQRSLRGLVRKIVYRSPQVDDPQFRGTGMTKGIHEMGRGQIALEGLALRLYRYFDRTLAAIGDPFAPEPMLTPTLIPATTLSKCDYFRSFPHIVTFTTHLPEDMPRIEDFRGRHQDRDSLDERALGDMVTPEACLSPAVCYHVYAANRDRIIPAEGLRYAVVGRCFRYESSKMTDLRRLWEFTMREIVFLGRREDVLGLREHGNGIVARYLADHEIAGEIRTASDPFFIAPDADAKTYFQLSSDTKWEISLCLPENERLAAGSLNYHTDFFGRAFHCDVADAGPMHSVCIAFGLERWVYAFLMQHGDDPLRWPDVVRRSPEIAGAGGRGAMVSVPPAPAWTAGGEAPAGAAEATGSERGGPATGPVETRKSAADVTVERVDPSSVVEEASLILREAWTPPVLHYSAQYLAWQFGFPGTAQGAIARVGGEPAGFMAFWPRRFRFRGEALDGVVLSFLGVRPSFQGYGLGGKLYMELLEALREQKLISAVYVEANSPAAQKLLFKSVERAGFALKRLGQYVNHGYYQPWPDPVGGTAVAREARDLDEVLAAIDACADPRVLWVAPGRAQLEHYLRDPRPRKLLVVEREGRVTSAGMALLMEIANKAGGIDRMITLQPVFLPDPSPDQVEALVRCAIDTFRGQATAPVVSMPSVATVPPEVLHAARLKPTGAVYDGFVIHAEPHPFLEADVTNLEVI